MGIRDRKGLKAQARQCLSNHPCDVQKLVSQHVGITLAVGLVLTIVNFLLDRQIAGTGGLSGVGQRAVLETARSVLQLLQIVAVPFWQFGWIYATMQLARGQEVSFSTLLEGFRRFGPVLRLTLLQSVVYLLVAFGGSYLGTFFFMMTPWAKPLVGIYGEAVAGNWDADAIYEAMPAVMEQIQGPMILTYLSVFLLLMLPVFYKLRLAQYCLADRADGRALAAMGDSLHRMRRNAGNMLKLDISFWWFYVLEIAVAAVVYLDIILPSVGVALPWPDWVSYFGVFIVYGLCQLALYRWRKPQVDVTYVKAYEALGGHEIPRPPKNMPWN